MYIDKDGNKYKSKEEYYNSTNLDLEDIYIFLQSGLRTPQNETEKKIKNEIDDILLSGSIIETNLSF